MNDCPNASSNQEFIIVAFSMSSSGQLELSLGILIIYLITVVGNLTIIFLVCLVTKLHTPMYFFLSNLAIVDVTSTSTCWSFLIVNSALSLHLHLLVAVSINNCSFCTTDATCSPLLSVLPTDMHA
ncbi:hypothetical protein GDO78_013779 [Eleutherodactylus coqui]|uniref:G-protein coupled receptors family 1 profile domain-containing protein n=1 Tax=Eleutherodactylus coqui TaxID=57060 RepID=A0A8J6EFK4_ELECQ|nr:hypothetical protein GDO78_013779 [Eleutherodactylus coqui]